MFEPAAAVLLGAGKKRQEPRWSRGHGWTTRGVARPAVRHCGREL